MTHENSAVQQITNNNLVVIALDSLSVTKLKEMTSYLKGAYIYVGKQPFGFSLWCLFFTILVIEIHGTFIFVSMDFKKEFKDHHKCIADVELILPSVPYYMEIFWHLKANLQTTQFKCN